MRVLANSTHLPWTFRLNLVGGGGIARARNRVTADFIRSGDYGILGIDYDLLWKPQDVVNVISRDMLCCGGLYTTREDRGHWVLNPLNGSGLRDDGLCQVMELGTGFKYYRKEFFSQLIGKNPWLEYKCDDTKRTEWGFYSMGPVQDSVYWPGESRWLTEDYWLDWLTRDAGIPVVADTTVQLRHKDGDKIYPSVFPPLPGLLPAEAVEL
jgi:hypothetical protein